MGVVLVTGCRSGFGYETALAFGRRGDTVYATMRDPARGDRLRRAVAVERLPVTVERLDVTDGDDISAVVGQILATHGHLDVLVNNAGLAGALGPVEELDEDAMRLVLDTNVWGPVRLCKAVLPSMRARGNGIIVNVSSFLSRCPGSPMLAAYGMSKAMLSHFTESLQAEIAPFGVRCVAVEPGIFATDFYSEDKRPTIDGGSPYASVVAAIDVRSRKLIQAAPAASIVADVIVRAVDDPHTPTRTLVGTDAIAVVDAQIRADFTAWTSQTDHR